MRIAGGIERLLMATVAAVTLGAGSPGAGVTIVGGTPEQASMARWAVGRFEAEGLDLPRLEIRFLEDRSGCEGRLGIYEDGVTALCMLHANQMSSRTLLHEMAHGWLEANVTGIERDLFLQLRGLRTWNDQGAGWEERGFEHGAEIIAWAIGDQGDGTLLPSFPDNARHQLAEAYEQLTGDPLPTLQPWMKWSEPD